MLLNQLFICCYSIFSISYSLFTYTIFLQNHDEKLNQKNNDDHNISRRTHLLKMKATMKLLKILICIKLQNMTKNKQHCHRHWFFLYV